MASAGVAGTAAGHAARGRLGMPGPLRAAIRHAPRSRPGRSARPRAPARAAMARGASGTVIVASIGCQPRACSSSSRANTMVTARLVPPVLPSRIWRAPVSGEMPSCSWRAICLPDEADVAVADRSPSAGPAPHAASSCRSSVPTCYLQQQLTGPPSRHHAVRGSGEVASASAAGRKTVVFVHGLWLLDGSGSHCARSHPRRTRRRP